MPIILLQITNMLLQMIKILLQNTLPRKCGTKFPTFNASKLLFIKTLTGGTTFFKKLAYFYSLFTLVLYGCDQ